MSPIPRPDEDRVSITRAQFELLLAALALVVKYEWDGGDCAGSSICSECCAPKYPTAEQPHTVAHDGERHPVHKPGCEWGRVVGLLDVF